MLRNCNQSLYDNLTIKVTVWHALIGIHKTTYKLLLIINEVEVPCYQSEKVFLSLLIVFKAP
jgi:hypothetical protein